MNDHRTESISTLRPAAPGGLADRCGPRAARDEAVVERTWRDERMLPRTRWLGRAAAVAAACVVVAALAWPSRHGPAAADLLDATFAALDDLDAVHVRVRALDEAGAGTQPVTEMWLLRGVGLRTEHGSQAEVYDLRRGERALLDFDRGTTDVVAAEEPEIVELLLERARVQENVDAMRALALRDAGALGDEIAIDDDGNLVRRLSGSDERGRPITVDLDPTQQRVVSTRVWTEPTAGGPARVCVVSTYSYPDPTGMDRALFDARPAGMTVVETGALHAHMTRMQCMVALRDMAMMVQLYANDHGGNPPSGFADLVPYAQRPIAEYCSCSMPGRDEPAPVVWRLDPESFQNPTRGVLFECRLPDGLVRAFVDGHVAFIDDAEADE